MSKKTLVNGTKSPGWVKCPRCGWLLYGKRLARNLKVCPECGHHCRLSPRERIGQLTDPGTFTEHGRGLVAVDVLEFVDRKPYRQRLDEAMAATGESEAAIYGTATISGNPVVIVAMNFAFMGGSMGVAVGEAVVQAADLARRRRTPLLLFTASGGARMQEGCLSLIQMARTSQAIGRLRAAGVLCVSLLTDPTFGGVTASFAMLGDVIIAESGALIGFAGPRVIAETIRQQLPDGFQTAEFLLRHGMVDRVEPRAELRPLLARILSLHATKRGSLPAPSGQPPIDDPEVILERAADPWEVVRIARHIERPTTLDYIDAVFTDFCELHGDRTTGDDPAIVGGLARLGERTVVVIGHQKGHTTKELVARNFGMAHPEGYRKALRLMEHAAAFGLPVLTLVDTPGAFPGIEAEERGQSGAIAACIMRSAQLPVPVVSVVTGEGGSGGALALATADRVLMLERSFYSVISPEGCAAILWRTRDAAPEAARALGTTATDLLRLGIVDAVVPEPAEGAHAAAATVAGDLRRALVDSLHELTRRDPAALIDARHTRLRDIGSGAGGGVLMPARSA